MFMFEGIPETKSREEFRLELLWPTRTTGKSRGLGLGPQGAEGLGARQGVGAVQGFPQVTNAVCPNPLSFGFPPGGSGQ